MGGPIQYGPTMGGTREGEIFIASPYYHNDPRPLKECRPP